MKYTLQEHAEEESSSVEAYITYSLSPTTTNKRAIMPPKIQHQRHTTHHAYFHGD